MPGKALLVIDMQKGSFTPETPRFDTAGVVERINLLAAACRLQNDPVIWVQHDGSANGDFLPETAEWELLDELDVKPADIRLSKSANDVFYRSELASLIASLGIEELLICGCATDFCVESTVQSALVRDYSITIVSDGHTTADRPHLSAEQVIAHYNWVWQGMLPTRGSIRVLPAESIHF